MVADQRFHQSSGFGNEIRIQIPPSKGSLRTGHCRLQQGYIPRPVAATGLLDQASVKKKHPLTSEVVHLPSRWVLVHAPYL